MDGQTVKPALDSDSMRDSKVRLLHALGAHVLHWRKQRQLTQEVLAERAGMSAKFVSEIEAGKRNLSIWSALRLMGGLDLTGEEFFRFLPQRSRKNALTDKFRSALENGQVRIALVALLDASEGSVGARRR